MCLNMATNTEHKEETLTGSISEKITEEKKVEGVAGDGNLSPITSDNVVDKSTTSEQKKKKSRPRKKKPATTGEKNAELPKDQNAGPKEELKKKRPRKKKIVGKPEDVTQGKQQSESLEVKPDKRPSAETDSPLTRDASTQTDDVKNDGSTKTPNLRHAANDKRRFSEADNFAQLIHKLCLEAKFQETGQNYMHCPANFFEITKLKPLYDKYLTTCLKKACPTEQERIRAKLFLLRSLRPNVSFKAGIISGVAGSGKSTLIRKLAEGKTKAITVLANPRLKETDFKGSARTFTLQDVLLSVVPMQADVIVVDEYTLAESAELLLLQRKLKASFMLLVGDVAQGTATSASSLEYLCLPTVYSSQVSHRMGKATAELCKKHGQNFVPCGGEDRVEHGDYEGETDSTDKNLAFTQSTVDDLKECGLDCSLVIDAQGKEYDSVTLFIRNEDREAAAVSHARAVALTRHKKLLVIRAEREIAQAFLIGELSDKPVSNAHKYHNEKFTHEESGGGKAE